MHLNGQIGEGGKEYLEDSLMIRLENARKTNNHHELAEVYFMLGELRQRDGKDPGESLDYYLRSLDYFKLLSDEDRIHQIKRVIARRYHEAELYEESETIYDELILYYAGNGDRKMLMYCHADLSDLYRTRGDLDKEYSHLHKAIALNNKVKDSSLMISYLLKSVDKYSRLSEVDSALISARMAFGLANDLNRYDDMSKALYHIGMLNHGLKKNDLAIKYLTDSEDLLIYRPYDSFRSELYMALADAHRETENHQESYLYMLRYAELNDSIYDIDRQESINSLTLKYETRQKQSEIRLLEKENDIAVDQNKQQRRALYVMAGGLVLLLLMGYYFYRIYTQKIKTAHIINLQKQKINSQRIRELEDNMKINSMQSMIEGQEVERERIAKELHDSLGGILSTIKLQFDSVKHRVKSVTKAKEYSTANRLLDTAVEEVRSISRNLQPSSLRKLGLIPAINDLINRFSGENYPDIDFQYYNIPTGIENMKALSIYRIIQEMLHNTVKHAEAEEVFIQLRREEDQLVIHYEDDGVGFNPEKLVSKGMGMENIRSRINYLKGTFSLDSYPSKGTSYVVHIPHG